jgi:DnaJ domain
MSAKADDVRRAYAVFGLGPGAPAAQVRRRYKALARQWHPDRHARDARNQAEASARMREINAAYRCLADHLAPPRSRPATSAAFLEGSQEDESPGRPLSREELDRMVDAIGSDGPVDWLLDGLGSASGALKHVLLALLAAACLARFGLVVGRGGAIALFGDSTLFLLVALLALLLLRERMARL